MPTPMSNPIDLKTFFQSVGIFQPLSETLLPVRKTVSTSRRVILVVQSPVPHSFTETATTSCHLVVVQSPTLYGEWVEKVGKISR